jgi:hypothetical protein
MPPTMGTVPRQGEIFEPGGMVGAVVQAIVSAHATCSS